MRAKPVVEKCSHTSVKFKPTTDVDQRRGVSRVNLYKNSCSSRTRTHSCKNVMVQWLGRNQCTTIPWSPQPFPGLIILNDQTAYIFVLAKSDFSPKTILKNNILLTYISKWHIEQWLTALLTVLRHKI